jgi:hypothetical protein
MPRPDKGENWIRVHDEMPDHPKIEGLSDRGFRLLISTWCWCNRNLTDGQVPAKIWSKRGTCNSRRELVDGGLVEQLEDGSVQVHDYLYWQRSATEIAEAVEKKKRAGQKGNHERWHVKEGQFDSTCELCQEERNGSHTASQVRSQVGAQNGRTRIAEREGEGEGEVSSGQVGKEGGARETRAIAPRCPLHASWPDTKPVPPCRGCGDARKAADEQSAADKRRAAEQAAAERREAVELKRREITACDLCDERGYRGRALCHHNPDLDAIARNGNALVQKTLATLKESSRSRANSPATMELPPA